VNELKDCCQTIKQAPNNGIESAECNAIKFDDGFTQEDNVVDYIEIIENGLIMIEMKDLQLKILDNFGVKPTKKELEKVFKNMISKFQVSYQLAKQKIDPSLIKVSNYLVWKDNTDIVLMDRYLPTDFKEKPYQICKTNEICKKLSKLDTRICK
jgi:hypothetical protein